jgi:hypothetical protein
MACEYLLEEAKCLHDTNRMGMKFGPVFQHLGNIQAKTAVAEL